MQYTGVPTSSSLSPSAQARPADPRASPDLVSLEEIRQAAVRLAGVAVRTPLVPFGPPLAGDARGRPAAWIKAECLQPIGAFKIRGAYNAMAQLAPGDRARGVVAHSSGNHAQGVSRAARLLGIDAVVVMPRDATRVKLEAVRADGARVLLVGSDSDERVEKARQLAVGEGRVLIPAYDDRRIVAGQGTAGLEIVEQLAEAGLQGPPTVLVPVGGGGLASGVAAAVKALRPDAHVYGVEPALAADARESLRRGRIVSWSAARVARTCADGMRTRSLGGITFAHLRALLDDILVVSEEHIVLAMLRAAQQARLVLEPSGATSLAAWLFGGGELPGDGPVIAVASGGNVDPEHYADLLARGLAVRSR